MDQRKEKENVNKIFHAYHLFARSSKNIDAYLYKEALLVPNLSKTSSHKSFLNKESKD